MTPTFESLVPQLEALTKEIIYRPGYERLAEKVASRLYSNVGRYIAIQALVSSVPAVFIMCTHERESSGDFGTYLGNGQRLDRRTTIVPTGRGPFNSFEDGAVDALKLEGLDKVTNWTRGALCYRLIGFNGWGYYYHGILASPYAFAGSTLQVPGKYVRDGVFDPDVLDPQIGAMLIYDQLCKMYPALALP